MGCTEARRRCDWDSRCSLALNRYMTYCGKLFNGLRCTPECRAVIEDMLAVPKAVLLNDCVCDGLERPICESVKENMARLCFGADMGGNGAGSSGGSDGGLEEYYDEDYEEEPSQKGRDDAEDNAGSEPGFPASICNFQNCYETKPYSEDLCAVSKEKSCSSMYKLAECLVTRDQSSGSCSMSEGTLQSLSPENNYGTVSEKRKKTGVINMLNGPGTEPGAFFLLNLDQFIVLAEKCYVTADTWKTIGVIVLGVTKVSMMCCNCKGGQESLDKPATGQLGHRARDSKPMRLRRSAHSSNGVTLLKKSPKETGFLAGETA
ncbi:hypothetical protein Q9966_014063 [Columba livia]|nr:hypothetical protein Q9966_014063 [Columba livia]